MTLPSFALAIDRRRHHHADVDDPAVIPDLAGSVRPTTGRGRVHRPADGAKKPLHHHVQLLTDPATPGLLPRYPAHPRALTRSSRPPRGYTFHVGLLDHSQQSSLAATPWLQQDLAEVTPLSELRDVQPPSSLHGFTPTSPADPPTRWTPSASWARAKWLAGVAQGAKKAAGSTRCTATPVHDPSSASTLRASHRKSTSPSIPPLCNSSSRSILSLTTVVLLFSSFLLCPLRMTRWSLFLQTLSLLHHFLGLYCHRRAGEAAEALRQALRVEIQLTLAGTPRQARCSPLCCHSPILDPGRIRGTGPPRLAISSPLPEMTPAPE